MLELGTSEVVPALNLSSACLPCCRVLFLCAPGLIVAPEEFPHLLEHACLVFFFQSSYRSAFCSPLSHNNAHTQTCCIHLPAPLLVLLEGFNASPVLLDCLYDHLSSFVRSFLSHIQVLAVSPWPSVTAAYVSALVSA